jgi:redox-sensitive bicupin YhaK (pirin superfamily)
MKTVLYPANERGGGDFGWLKAKHSFSFGQWQDASKIHFGALRVLNDDIIAPGAGFPTHPHDNMEIITIPLQGALQHKDSSGGEGIIQKNDIQIMSAGTGVQHSEYNASTTEAVNLLQLWIFPKEKNITPRYDQKTFTELDRINKWQVVVSNEKTTETLWINQDANLALTQLEKDKSIGYKLKVSNGGVYLFVIKGSIKLNENVLQQRDAIGIYATENFSITANENAEVLLIEIPLKF